MAASNEDQRPDLDEQEQVGQEGVEEAAKAARAEPTNLASPSVATAAEKAQELQQKAAQDPSSVPGAFPHGKGTQLFISPLPHCSEEVVKNTFQMYGTITAIIMRASADNSAEWSAFLDFAEPSAWTKIEEAHAAEPLQVQGKTLTRCELRKTDHRAVTEAAMSPAEEAAKRAGKIFVGGLPLDSTEEQIKEYFQQFGEVTNVIIQRKALTQAPRGFGFVEFASVAAVDALLQPEVWETHKIGGKWVDTKRALSRDDAPNSSRERKGKGKGFKGRSWDDWGKGAWAGKSQAWGSSDSWGKGGSSWDSWGKGGKGHDMYGSSKGYGKASSTPAAYGAPPAAGHAPNPTAQAQYENYAKQLVAMSTKHPEYTAMYTSYATQVLSLASAVGTGGPIPHVDPKLKQILKSANGGVGVASGYGLDPPASASYGMAPY